MSSVWIFLHRIYKKVHIYFWGRNFFLLFGIWCTIILCISLLFHILTICTSRCKVMNFVTYTVSGFSVCYKYLARYPLEITWESELYGMFEINKVESRNVAAFVFYFCFTKNISLLLHTFDGIIFKYCLKILLCKMKLS